MRKEIKLVPGVAYNMQVAARSSLGASPYSPIIYIPAQAKSTPPTSVTGLSLGYYGVQFVASWNASTESDFDYYKYYFLKGPSYSTPSITKKTISTKIALTDVENRSLWGDGALNNDIKIVVSVVDKSGNESSLVTSSAANNTGPVSPTLSNFSVTPGVDSISLSWAAPTGTGNIIDIVKYNIYVSTTTDNLGDFSLVDSTASLFYNYRTTYYDKAHYFYIKSVDKFGNESSTGSAIVSTRSGPESPSVLSNLIRKIDSSYSRQAGTGLANFHFNSPHGLNVGDQIFIADTISDSVTITNISVTGTTGTATVSTAHNFAVGDSVSISASSNDSFNERVIITSVTTSPPHTFTYYKPTSSGSYSGTAYAYAHTGLSTLNTPPGTPATVTYIFDEDSFRCIPNGGTCAVDTIPNQSGPVNSISSDGVFTTYNIGGGAITAAGQAVGLKVRVRPGPTTSPTGPSVFYVKDTDIFDNTTTSVKIRSSATGNYVANSASLSIDPPGYMYPNQGVVRVNTDGIVVANLSTGFIVAISPTSFQMQSSSDATRLAITSNEIAMYKNGTQSVSFKSDGTFLLRSVTGGTGTQRIVIDPSGIALYDNNNSKTVSLDGLSGNATIVGKFATGFSPDARVELDSGSSVPESISFYNGLSGETPGSITSEVSGSNSGVLSITSPKATGSYKSANITLTSSGTGNPNAQTRIGSSGSGSRLFVNGASALFSTADIGGTTLLNIDSNGISSPAMGPRAYFTSPNVNVPANQTGLSRLPDTGTVIGATFTAPPSGTVFINVSGTLLSVNSTSKLGWFLRNGATIGSGTLVTTGDESIGAALVYDGDAAANSYLGASAPLYLQTGLTAGLTYNVTFGHYNSSASTKTVGNRRINIIPCL